MLMDTLFIQPLAAAMTIVMPEMIIRADVNAVHPVLSFVVGTMLMDIFLVTVAALVIVLVDSIVQHFGPKESLVEEFAYRTLVQARESITIHSTPGEAYIPCYFGSERYADAVRFEELAHAEHPLGYVPEAQA